MKHLKRFDESAFEYDEKLDDELKKKTQLEKVRELQDDLDNTLFTPKTEQVSLKSLYKAIVIKTQEPINTKYLTSFVSGYEKVYDTNWIVLEFRFNKWMFIFYPNENAINSWIGSIDINTVGGGRIGDFRDYLMLDYNDINHAEIENILSEYGVVVDEMWGIPV
jgi:hypothetical protein